MLNNTRIEPTSQNFYPSAPPMNTATLPPYSSHPPTSNYNGNFNPSASSPSHHPQPPSQLNVPQIMYSMPTTTTAQPSPVLPMATLKPMPQPPPAPALNEVMLSEDRQRVRCPYCGASITTTIQYRTGMMSHIAAFAIFFVCCPLAWIPYCIDMCKDVDHTCPNCSRLIGKFRRFT